MNVFQLDIVYSVWKTGLRGVEAGDGKRLVQGRCELVRDSTVFNGCTAPEVISIMVQGALKVVDYVDLTVKYKW